MTKLLKIAKIIILTIVTFGLYGILLVLVYTITLDKLLAVGASRTKLEIVSKKHEKIRAAILEDLDRGVTLLHGQTGYFGLETDRSAVLHHSTERAV